VLSYGDKTHRYLQNSHASLARFRGNSICIAQMTGSWSSGAESRRGKGGVELQKALNNHANFAMHASNADVNCIWGNGCLLYLSPEGTKTVLCNSRFSIRLRASKSKQLICVLWLLQGLGSIARINSAIRQVYSFVAENHVVMGPVRGSSK